MKNKILIFIFLIFFIIVVAFIFYKNKDSDSRNFFKEKKSEFLINKVKYYSSVNAISNTTNYQNPEWNLNIYQYTDIALYLNRISDSAPENYLTKLCLKDFEVSSENTKVYYLNLNNYGNSDLHEEDVIENKLEYNVINSSNEKNEQTYNIPIYFQDCSNPITIRVVTILSDNYKVSNDKTLSYNGSIMKELGFSLNRLNKKLKFDIEIENSLGDKHCQNVNLEIPYNDEEKSIIDGDFEKDVNVEIKF